jgi:hypothetical protein
MMEPLENEVGTRYRDIAKAEDLNDIIVEDANICFEI